MTITTTSACEHPLEAVSIVPADRPWLNRGIAVSELALTALGESKTGVITHEDLLSIVPVPLSGVLGTAVRLLVDEDLVASYPLQREGRTPVMILALTAHGRQLLDERAQLAASAMQEGSA